MKKFLIELWSLKIYGLLIKFSCLMLIIRQTVFVIETGVHRKIAENRKSDYVEAS